MKSRPKGISLSPPQILVFGFALIITAGAFLLSLPIASATGKPTPLVDAFFTATSALTVTGLVVVDTGTHYSLFGQITILLLIQAGGLGFMSVATMFALMMRKKISLRDRLVLQQAMNQGSMEGIVRLIRKVLYYSLAIETIGAIIFAIRFSADMNLGKAAYYGVFHAITLFTNAGFDLHGEFKSFTEYVSDPVVNLTGVALIILGGLGFVVLADLAELGKPGRRLSLHSKVVLSTTAALILLGTAVLFVFEFTNSKSWGTLNGVDKLFASLFQSVTTRSGGAVTVNIADMRQASQFFMILLMFIGAGPGSTGGGIKVTTFTVLISAMLAMLRGKEDVVLFRFRIAKDRVYKALTVTLFALLLVIFVAMVLSTTEDRMFLPILFETTSAFGTVGASMGITPQLSAFGKIMIMLTMYIGRLGPLTLAYALNRKTSKDLYRHPEGKIIIG